MNTDHGLAEFFASVPKAIGLLLPASMAEVRYDMVAPELKRVERRLDACFIPQDETSPLLAIEFQGYLSEGIYYNALAKGGLLGEQFPKRALWVIVIFLAEALDPRTEPWHELGCSGYPGFQVLYLPELIERLCQRDPEDPTAMLLGVLVDSARIDAADARRRYKAILKSEMAETERESYVKLLLYWLMQRLRVSKEELKAMIGYLTPLQETPAYKEIFAEGHASGLAIGQANGEAIGAIKASESTIAALRSMRDRGLVTDEGYRELVRQQEAIIAQWREYLSAEPPTSA